MAGFEVLMELVDTHCHLDFEPLAAKLDPALERARATGVSRIVAPSYDAQSRNKVVELGTKSGVFPALGLHPWVANENLDIAELGEQITCSGAVAVGEIGLDTKIERPDFDCQLEVFRAQVRLAAELDLPVILHCRGAFDEMLEVLRSEPRPVRGVVHAYSRGPELAQRLLGAGLVLGIGGAATRPRARRLHRTLKRISLDCLVLETDAPSIGLDGVDAREAEPCHVAQVAAAVATISGVDIAEVARCTTATAERLFGLVRVESTTRPTCHQTRTRR
jgi:TatD DNase family protein